MLFSKKTDKQQMDKFLKKFVTKLEDKDELDEKIKNDIIELATTWNKEELMQDLIEKVEVHKSYDEEEGVQFPYKSYVERFFDDGKGQENAENQIYDKDVFLRGLQKGSGAKRNPFDKR